MALTVEIKREFDAPLEQVLATVEARLAARPLYKTTRTGPASFAVERDQTQPHKLGHARTEVKLSSSSQGTRVHVTGTISGPVRWLPGIRHLVAAQVRQMTAIWLEQLSA